ncbi:hypothetical protein SETIT_8G038100v2 [Setaria italica]|uniref:Uncharacterized protein n=1 Tax=Setaria italica TaxID=4555 RepID=A0A368S3X0_SETIT|nr:hypothetical protein SETIT_8G038100v2 [Setaria italica]
METLPLEVVIEITIHVAATSDQPMDDLCNLRATCRLLHCACSHCAVGRRVALLRCWEDMEWYQPDRYYSLLHLLVGVGNPEASMLRGILDFFGGAGGLPSHPSLDELSRAATGGLNVAAYLYAVMLYRNVGGTADDDIAKMYVRRVEGEEGTVASGSIGPMKLGNFGCRECRGDAVYLVWRITWCKAGDALPPAPVHGEFPCAGGGCGFPNGWGQAMLFCSEDCRLRHEIAAFEQRLGIDI